ncbi:MAG TPA: barstar family protein [Candidatus Dormibacteraeota bacterium]|nr:barstar family protein [Candidatus Dormibacteraeota bacterium]
MIELIMDGVTWNGMDDVYDAFFRVVGAPDWHGRNFDALNDSISHGGINKIEVPYRLVILNFDLIGDSAKKMAADFVDLVHGINARGVSVEIDVRNSR